MLKPKKPDNEAERLQALRDLDVLDTPTRVWNREGIELNYLEHTNQ